MEFHMMDLLQYSSRSIPLRHPDTTLFPVQLVEAICLLILAVVLAILDLKEILPHTVAIYFIVYGILRFLLEYVRYDAVRGHLFALSTSSGSALDCMWNHMLSYQNFCFQKKRHKFGFSLLTDYSKNIKILQHDRYF